MAETDGGGSSLEARVIGVCVGKEKKGFLALKWALDNIVPRQGSVYLLHVRSPLHWIPSPLGGKLPVDDVNPELVKRFKEERFQDTKNLVNDYKRLCDKKKVTSVLCYAENDSVPKELVDQISKLGITNLVLESSPPSFLKVRKTESISAYVAKFAPDFCTVMVIRKGKLYSVKDATQSSSFQCSSRSISVASDLSISLARDSISSGEIVEDNLLMPNGISQDEERDMQPNVKVDLCCTAHGRLQQSVSMDFTQGSPEWHMSHYGDRGGYQSPVGRSEMRRNFSTPPQSRLFESASATPFYQRVLSPHDSNNSQSVGGFESRASLASDIGLLEAFFENDSPGHEFTTPTRVPLENFISPSANARLSRTSDSPDCDARSQTSMDIGHSTSSHTLEGSSIQTSVMDSNTEFASDELMAFGYEVRALIQQ